MKICHKNRALTLLMFFLISTSCLYSFSNDENENLSLNEKKSSVSSENVMKTDKSMPIKKVSNISALVNISEKEAIVEVEDDDRGGVFSLIHDAGLVADNGLIFQAENIGDGWYWVRKTEKDDPTNIKWYGAKGMGLSHYKEDSAAITNAIAALEKKGGGKLYFPASDNYYGFNGDGILLPDNIEIYGDGPKSEIMHVNPSSGTYYRGVIFFTTTYGPNISASIVSVPSYPILETPENQKYVIVKNSASLKNLTEGLVIGLGSNKFFKNNDSKQIRFGQFELNEITRISNDTVYLKYPTSLSFQTKNNKKEPPAIIDVNGNHTSNEQLSRKKKTKVFNRVTKNIYIHDLKLSQADHNLIDNVPYNNPKPITNPIALGGTFESRFENLVLDGFGTFGGNMWNRCVVSNLNITSALKLLDLGYGSSNTVIHDIKWHFRNNKADTVRLSLMYLNEASHHIEIYNVNADGPWSGQHLIQIGDGANHLSVHDITLNFPSCNAPDNYGIFIRDLNGQISVHDITLKNIKIKLGLIGQYIRLVGQQSNSVAKNIILDNIDFEGKTTRRQGYSVFVNDFGNLKMKDIVIPTGNIFFSKVQNGIIDGLKAPNSIVVCPDKTEIAPQILKSNIKGSSKTKMTK